MTGYLRLLQRHSAALGFGFLAVFWGNFGQTFFIGAFSASIQDSLAVTAGTYGAVYSLATLASALTVVWAGSLIDRVPLSGYTTALCLGLAGASLLMWQVEGLVLLAFGFYGLRLFGQALLPHTGMTTLARRFDQDRGKSLSIASSGVPVGEIVMPLIGVALIALVGWQTTFLLIALLMLLAVLPLMHYLIRRAGLVDVSTVPEQPRSAPMQARLQLLGDRCYWLALPGLMAPAFIVTGIFIHQDFVIASQGWTPAWFAICFVVYGTVHWLASLAVGLLVDRYGAVHLLAFYLLPMATGLFLMVALSGLWVAMLLMVLLALTIGAIPPITGALWAEVYGVASLGTIRSMNMAVMVFATSLSPIVYGIGIDRGVHADLMFGGSGVYVLLAAVLMSVSYRDSIRKTHNDDPKGNP